MSTAPAKAPRARRLEAEATALHDALGELVRVYQFRDRDRICCHDISVTQCYALEALIRRGPSGLNELAAELYLDKSTASRVVAALERKRYAARAPHPADGRAVVLTATPTGRRLYERIRADLIAEAEDLLEDFEPEVRQAAARLLLRLARAAATRSGIAPGSGCCPPSACK
jgi:MarR family transcriptional regulator, 2-MHQ and catechol-resistance regulon repressor